MPKGIDIDKIVAEVLRNLGKSNVVDDVAKVGGNMLDDISKALSEATGKLPKPKKPKTPKAPAAPKNPPKSGRGAKGPSKSEKAHHGGTIDPKTGKEFTSKPKSPKSGSVDAAERAAKKEAERAANKANWAKEREAYNQMKAIEREERKAANKAEWAKERAEKYGSNITEAVKATSRGRNRNRKKNVK